MRRWLLGSTLVVLAAGVGLGIWWSRNRLVPIPLASDADRFTPANPDPGQEQAKLEALLPQGAAFHAFVLRQVGETLLAPGASGAANASSDEAAPAPWTGVLAEALWGSPNRRHWRIRVRQAVWLHDGHLLDARWALSALRRMENGPFQAGAKGEVLDDRTFDLDFPGSWDLPARLSAPGARLFVGSGSHAIGSGPFRFAVSPSGETYLARFDGYRHGNAGIAELHLPEDPALLQGDRWAADMVARRYAWSIFPGNVPPGAMAQVRNAPYDPVRLDDGSVWFISRRMRRLHPDLKDWSRTALFGAWQADMDLPYDPR